MTYVQTASGVEGSQAVSYKAEYVGKGQYKEIELIEYLRVAVASVYYSCHHCTVAEKGTLAFAGSTSGKKN